MDQLDFPRVTQYYREKVVDHAIHMIPNNNIPTLSKQKVTGNKVFIKNMKKVIRYYNKVIKKLSPKYHPQEISKLEKERDSIQQTLDDPNDIRLRILKNLEADFVARDVYAPDLDNESDADDQDDAQPESATKVEPATESIEEKATTTESIQEKTTTPAPVEASGELPTDEASANLRTDEASANVDEAPLRRDDAQLSVEAPAGPVVDSLQREKEPLQANDAPVSTERPAFPDPNSLPANNPGACPEDIDDECFAPAGWLADVNAENVAVAQDTEVPVPDTHGDIGAATTSNEPQEDPAARALRLYYEEIAEDDSTDYDDWFDDYDVSFSTEESPDSDSVEQTSSVNSDASVPNETSVDAPGPATLWGILSSSSPADVSHSAPDVEALKSPMPTDINAGIGQVSQLQHPAIINTETPCETIDDNLKEGGSEHLSHHVAPPTKLICQLPIRSKRALETASNASMPANELKTNCDQPKVLSEETPLASDVEAPIATTPVLPPPHDIVEATGDGVPVQPQAAAGDTEQLQVQVQEDVPGPATLWGILASEPAPDCKQQIEDPPLSVNPACSSLTPISPESPEVDVAVAVSSPAESSFSEDASTAIDEPCSGCGKEDSSSKGDESSILLGSPSAKTTNVSESTALSAPATPVKVEENDQNELNCEELVEDHLDFRNIGTHLDTEAIEYEATMPATMPDLALQTTEPLDDAKVPVVALSSIKEELTIPTPTGPKADEVQTSADATQAATEPYEPPKWSLTHIFGCAVAITVPMVIIYPTIGLLGAYGLIRYARSQCN
ncbi:hypothetical protein PV10_03136 [Exophiala mesophila]|uniref:Uncharacterized protein n=1 Tax=Exophiala mesophila TaxID=212818 RepID=A0A0D1ZNH4_EXOME|nr:uncharacterized protein PV10_03136 [Exophiala mesophila]KIV95484.1 hypothetical protein PV10_03136 [Exophiala mesophila]